MASSHHKHRQDKTVLPCRCSQCELSSWQSQTVFSVLETEQFCLVCGVNAFVNWFPNDVTIGNYTVCELETGSGQDKSQFTPHFETGKTFEIFSLDLSPIQFTPRTPTRQDSLVSVFVVWTSHNSSVSVLTACHIINCVLPVWSRTGCWLLSHVALRLQVARTKVWWHRHCGSDTGVSVKSTESVLLQF